MNLSSYLSICLSIYLSLSLSLSIYLSIYRYIGMSEYIEYKVDTFGLQKHLLESVKKPIHRKKASPGIEEEKKKLYIEYFLLSILY